jgi:glycerol-3-phosphate dehydrogenase
MTRSHLLQQLEDPHHTWDVIVIGGGATGLGTAVDSAGRGYRTLLLERNDFASGTSSRSTKLIHGGVRYLRQGDLALVMDSLKERGILLRNAPHLVHNLPFIVPLYEWWEGTFYGAGLTLYDVLAGRLGMEPSRHLTREETLSLVPTLSARELRGGIMYHDGQFDDSRLAVSLARTLVDLGGVPINYCAVTNLTKINGLTSGVEAVDRESGKSYRLQSRVVINATGVFTDSIRKLDDSTVPAVIRPSQGIHLVVAPSFLPGSTAIMVPHTDDGRVLFAIPWHDRVLIGTTDTPVSEISQEPCPGSEEIDFLLEHAGRYLVSPPNRTDILSIFAGLRPLVGSNDKGATSTYSRDHKVIVSRSGLVTITGGKWTTYRLMAQDTVDQAAVIGGLPHRPSNSVDQRIHGWQEAPADDPLGVYGCDAEQVREMASTIPSGMERLHPGVPYLVCEPVWAVRHEFARTVTDVLARRTRALFLDAAAAIAMAPQVAALIAAELDRDESWQLRQIEEFHALAQTYLPKEASGL